MNNIDELKTNLYSNNWETSLDAADKLAELSTPIALSILIEGLKSNDISVRNASALGIREANNESAFLALWNRIVELGPDEQIGTLVYSMEATDCSNYLLEIINLYLNGNFEVENSSEVILTEQTFFVTDEELIAIKKELENHDMKIEDLSVKYKIKNEA
ncbi:MAG: hypothetical protein H7259_06200 [Cytophagales bacterium]|nr:hypothetical protein [Cytophaga sp.]